MRNVVTPLLVFALVLGMLAAPVSATAEEADAAADLPEACEGRTRDIRVDEGEQIVERTFYWSSASRVGNVDAWTNPDALRLVEDEPLETESSLYHSNAGNLRTGGGVRNPNFGYFARDVPNPGDARLVCYSAEFWALHANDVSIGLFSGYMEIYSFSESTGDGLADGIRKFTAKDPDVEKGFQRFNIPTHLGDSIVVRLHAFADCPPTPIAVCTTAGADVFYGSTEHPSSVTLVTVEKVE